MSYNLNTRLTELKNEFKQLEKQIADLNKRKRDTRDEIVSLEAQLTAGASLNNTNYVKTSYPWTSKVYDVLRNVFKLKDFRSFQLSAINATLSKEDCLLIMPTGGGKSLTFQLPALISKGLTVVVSPLISLMEDQLNHLRTLGIPSEVLNGNLGTGKMREIYKKIEASEVPIRIVFVTPEMIHKSKLLMKAFEKCHANGQLKRFVIDEVHCLSTWGHNFRPDYAILKEIKYLFPSTPILGLTATATPIVINNIQRELSIMGCPVFKDSFYRDNLVYMIENVDDLKKEQIVERISGLLKGKYANQSGLIYCLTIKDVEDLTMSLQGQGIRALPYHAQMEAEHRSISYRKWFQGTAHIIVATVAFGMGINKNDVRFVMHYSLSKTLENYYQETGRAGRDGRQADCILFYKYADIFRVSTLTASEKTSKDPFQAMISFCVNRIDCKKQKIAEYFGDDWNHACNQHCDNCQLKIEHMEVDATDDIEMIAKIIEHNSNQGKRLTFLKLLDIWLGKGEKKARPDDLIVPNYSRALGQQVIVYLLLDQFLREDFHYTAYATLSYAELGRRWHSASKAPVKYQLPILADAYTSPKKVKTIKTPAKKPPVSSVKKPKKTTTTTTTKTTKTPKTEKPNRTIEIPSGTDSEAGDEKPKFKKGVKRPSFECITLD